MKVILLYVWRSYDSKCEILCLSDYLVSMFRTVHPTNWFNFLSRSGLFIKNSICAVRWKRIAVQGNQSPHIKDIINKKVCYYRWRQTRYIANRVVETNITYRVIVTYVLYSNNPSLTNFLHMIRLQQDHLDKTVESQ